MSDTPAPTPHDVRLKLDRRIRNQRRALRETWEIVEMRRKWLGSYPALQRLCDLILENRKLRAENAELRASAIMAGKINPEDVE